MARFFNSNLRNVIKIHREIGATALKAAALVVERQAKMNARGGFKSGKFVTTGWNTITHRVFARGPRPHAQVGSTREHFLYWELGHHNIFTGQYERKEWLKPAFNSTRQAQQDAAKKAVEDYVAQAGRVGRAIGTAMLSDR